MGKFILTKLSGIILIYAVLIQTPCAYSQSINDDLAVKAIVGEASNQGYQGMLAVACAIRNRGSLNGVYGLKAKHVYREPRSVWANAEKAWKESIKADITGGATHWEAIKKYGKPYWVKSMIHTVTIGDHSFYREIRR